MTTHPWLGCDHRLVQQPLDRRDMHDRSPPEFGDGQPALGNEAVDRIALHAQRGDRLVYRAAEATRLPGPECWRV